MSKVLRIAVSIVLAVFTLLFATNKASANEYYWVGGTGNWSDFSHHWATSSGGSSFYLQVPQSVDNVHFDAGSGFTASSKTVTVDVLTASANNLDWTGAANTPIFTLVSGNSLNVAGSFTLISAMTVSFSGTLNFIATTTGKLITTAGKNLGNTNFTGIGGGWTLQSPYLSNSNLTLTGGSLNTNDQPVSISTFSTSGNNIRSLTLGASVVTVTTTSSPGWSVSGTNFSLTAGTSSIVFNGNSSLAGNFTGGNVAYYDVSWTNSTPSNASFGILSGGTGYHNVSFACVGGISSAGPITNLSFAKNATITGNNTITNLTLGAGNTYTFGGGSTQTISSLTANGTCNGLITLQSQSAGTQATLSQATGAVNFSYVSLKDIKGAGGAVFTANNSVNAGNNSNITINALTGRNLYWIGNSGNWDDGNHWSLTSGGPAAGCAPTSVDNVFFDANSFTLPGQTVTVNASTASFNDMDWTGVLNTPSFTCSSTNILNAGGSFTLAAGMNLNFSGTLNFISTTTGETISAFGKLINGPVNFTGIGGGWTLQNEFKCGSSIVLSNGTLNTNSQPVTAAAFTTASNLTRSLLLGATQFTLTSSGTVWNLSSTGLTFNAGTSSLIFNQNAVTSVSMIPGNNVSYYDVSFTGVNLSGATITAATGVAFHDVSFASNGTTFTAGTYNSITMAKAGTIGSGSANTINTLTLTPGYTYNFAGNSIQTIGNLLSAGTCNGMIRIQSNITGSQATITKLGGGNLAMDYVSLRDIKAGTSTTITATNSINAGNNSGVTITTLSSRNLYWIGNGGNWSDPNHWSLTSGGSPAGCAPNLLDNVFFDANSFTLPGQTVTLDLASNSVNNMDWTGVINTPTFSAVSTNSLDIAGSMVLSAGMNLNFSGILNFVSNTTGQTVSGFGKQFFGQVIFNGIGGGWTLQSDFKTSSQLNLSAGALNTNNQAVTAQSFVSSTGLARSLVLGSSIITLTANSGNVWNIGSSSLMTLNAGTSTIQFTDVNFPGFAGGTFAYYDVKWTANSNTTSSSLTGGTSFHNVSFFGWGSVSTSASFNDLSFTRNGTLSGTNTFGNLTFSPGFTYNVTGTQTITSAWNATGTGSLAITLNGVGTISKASGTVCNDYLRVTNITVTGGATFNVGPNGQDVSGNTGWNFAPNVVTISVGLPTSQACLKTSGNTFTAAPVNGGTATFEWFVNGVSVQNSTSATYTNASLAVGNTVKVVMTSTFPCGTPIISNSNILTMVASPVVSAITGNTTVCVSSTTQLNDATSGGVWSSSNPAVATVSASGLVTGVANGSATISYAVTNGSNCTTSSSAVVTVNALPTLSVSSTAAAICAGASSTMTAVSGGGNAVHFNGVNTYIDLGTGVTLPATFTEEAWIYSGSGNDGQFHGFLGYQPASTNNRPPSMWIYNGRQIHGGFGTGTGFYYFITNDVILQNTWNHIAQTYDGTTLKCFVNGVEVGFQTYIAPPAGAVPVATGVKNIGRVDNYFQGDMDEVRIWNITRTQAEIQADMNKSIVPTTPGLVGYYKFSEGVNNTTADATSGGRIGTFVNAPTWVVSSAPVGATITWSPASGLNTTSGAVAIATPAATTTYIATATDATTSCVSTANYTITVNPLPTVSGITGATGICSGNSTTLTAASAATSPVFKWYTAATNGTLLATAASYTTPSLSATTTYYVEVTSGSCVSAARTAATVTVSPVPTVSNVSGTTSICTGTNTTLTAASTASSPVFKWYDAAAGGNLLFTGAAFTTPSLSANTAYYVEVSSNACVSASRTAVQVIVNALPPTTINISAVGSLTFCAGGSVVLKASSAAGNALQFNGGNYTESVNTALPLGNSSRTIEAWIKTTGGGAVVNWGTTLTQQRSGLLIINGHVYYVGENNDLQGSINVADGNWHHIAATWNGSTLRLYVDGNADGSANLAAHNTTGTTLRIGRRSVGDAQTEYFTGTVDEVRIWNVAKTQAELQASMNLNAAFNSPGLVAYYQLDETTGTSIIDATANNATGTLFSSPSRVTSGATINYSNYLWTTGATGAGALSITTSTAGNYSSIFTNANGCSRSTSALTVTVNPLPTITGVTGTTTICAGNTTTLTASSAATSPVFKWYDAATNGNLLFTGAAFTTPVLSADATYYVEVTSNTCVSAVRTAVTVTVNALPVVSTSVTPVSCAGGNNGTITINASAGSAPYDYSINGGANYQSGNIFTGLLAGTYNVKVRTAAGCSAATQQAIVATTPDITKPVPTLASLPDLTGECSVTVTNAPTATDNCSGLITGITTDPTSYSAQGTYTITWKYTDASGNTQIQTQQVIVRDVTKPVINCPADITVTVASGACNTSITVPAPTATDNCQNPPGSALDFDGVNDMVSVATGLPSMSDMTIETWLKPRAISNWDAIMNYSTFNTGDVHFQFVPDGRLEFSVAGNSPTDQFTTQVFAANQWYHFAAVYSASGKYVKFYVNGQLVDTRSYTTAISTSSNTPFGIGGWQGQRYFDGSLDDIRIWNSARTQAQLQASMNTTLLGTESNLLAYYNFNQGTACGNNISNNALTDLAAAGGNNSGVLQNFSLDGSQECVSNWTNGAPTTGISIKNNINNTSDASGTYSVGVTNVVWTATDAAGNQSTCTQVINVLAPEVNLTGNNITIAKGSATVTTADNTDFGTALPGVPLSKTFTIQNNGTSALTVPSITVGGANAAEFTVSGISFPVTVAANSAASFTVTFVSGVIATRNATIIVNNNDCNEGLYDFAVSAKITCVAPSFANTNVYVQASTASDACTAVVTYPLSVNGTNPNVTYTFTGSTTGSGSGTGSGQIYNKGVTHVLVSAANACGSVNTTFDITVVDNVVPVVRTKNVTIALDATGHATLNASALDNGSTDNCGAVTFATNSNGIICATAAEGNSLTLTAPAGKVISGINFASYGTPTGTCGNFAYGTCHASNSMSIVSDLAIGQNSVTIAADNSVFGDPCNGTVKKLYVEATYASIGTSNTFDCSKLGDNTVTLIVTDADGNSSSGTAVVTVVDNTKPVVVTRNIALCLDASGNAVITPAMIENGSTDNCSISGYSLDKTSFNSTNAGANTVTLSVTDGSGNVGTATAVVTINPLPTQFTVTGGGAYCTGTPGVTVGLSGSESGVNYQLKRGATVVTTVSGTGNAINFGIQTIAGSYTVVATNASTTCTRAMTGNATVVVNTSPVVTVAPSAATICAGGSAVLTASQNVTTTRTYSIALANLLNVPNSCISGSMYGNTGAGGFRWTDLGTGTVSNVKIEVSMGVDCNINNFSHLISLNGSATGVSMTGQNFCSCGSRTYIPVANFVPDNYVVGGTNTIGFSTSGSAAFGFAPAASLGNAFAIVTVTYTSGSNSPISNWQWTPGNETTAAITVSPVATSTYTVTGTDANGCTGTASATITVNPLPAIYTVTGGGQSCNNTSVAIGLSGSQTGVRYQLMRGATPVGSAVNGNGGAINFAGQSTPATYTVVATNTTTGCPSGMAGSVTITSGSTPVFANKVATLTANTTATSCDVVVSYPLSVSGVPSPDVNYVFSGATNGTGTGTGSGAAFNRGTTHVVVTAANSCGTVAYGFDVVVTDNVNPVISIPADISTNNDENACGAAIQITAATATDNCAVSSVTGVRNDGLSLTAAYPIGTTVITWTATDASNNTASGVQRITVTDNQPPAISCPVDINVFATSAAGTAVQFTAPVGTDNCGGVNTVQIAGLASGSVFPIGTTLVTYKATDAAGLSAECSFRVIVTGIAPVINCPVDILVNNTPGQCGAKVNFEATETTAIPASVITYSIAPGSFFPVGATTVTATATNAVGSSSCTFNVTVVDNELPVITVADVSAVTDQGVCSTAKQNAALGTPVTADNCGVASVTNDAPDNFPVGVTKVTWTVTDIHGNKATAEQYVTVTDNEIPVVITKTITVQLNAQGTVSIMPTDVNDHSTDNCGIASYSLDKLRFDCSNIGVNTVKLVVTDIHGNISSALATVLVEDKIPALILTRNITRQLNAAGTVSIEAAEVDNGSADACGISSMTVSPNSFTCANIGDNTVTLTVTDVNGNISSATAVVTVEDKVPAVVVTKNITVQLNASGAVSIAATDVNNGSNDACGIASMVVSPNSFTCANIGDNTVTLTVTDVNGNISSAAALVTVQDKVPAVVVTKNITVQLNASGVVSIAAADVDNGSNDACGIASMVVSPGNFTCANIGLNTVTLFVKDVNGNTSSATAVVTVEDRVPAVVITRNITINLDPTGNASITPVDINNGSSDACGIASMAVTPNSFNCANVGANIVTLTVTDVNGNVSSKTATVTVQDATAPVVLTKDITVNLSAAGTVGITAADVNNGSSDACGIRSMSVSPNSFTCTNVGDNTVTLTVTDVNGNVSKKTARVTVVDATPAVVLTRDITIQLNATGTASITAADVNNGSSDACGIASLVVSPNSFTCANVGRNTVTLTAFDVNGNVSSKTATVTVEDKTTPVITTLAKQVFCANANGSTQYTIPSLATADACGVASISYSIAGATTRNGSGNNASGTFNAGLSTISWTVRDVNNNVSYGTTDVQINTLPVASVTASTADAFCNKVTLTASSTLNPASYHWMSGSSAFGNSQSVNLDLTNGDGIYSVLVTDNNTGCTSAAAATYNYQKQNLSSSYTILTFKDAKIGKYNKVNSGSVGVMTAGREAEFKSYSSVTGAGSFVKAPQIDRDGTGIVINSQVIGVANVNLPTMQFNTASTKGLPNYNANTQNATIYGNYDNLTVKKDMSVTVTGNTFGTIKLEEGASIKFTSSVLNIGTLQADKGKKNTNYSYIRFTGGTSVRVSSKVNIGSQVWVNPDNNQVTFYMGDLKSDEEKFTINGGDTKVTANIYMPDGKLKVNATDAENDDHDACDHKAHTAANCKHKGHDHNDCDHRAHNAGDCSDDVYMTGLFIAESLESHGNTVVWNSFSCGAAPAVITSINTINAGKSTEEVTTKAITTDQDLKVTVMPNPSTTFFTLKFESRYETPLNIRVMDGAGRVVDARSKVGANSTLQIGHTYSSGTYYAEIIQGGQRKVVQLIKARG